MTSATFKCLISGHTVTFTNPVDIASMKGHTGYEEVKQGQETPKEVLSSKKSSKKTTEEAKSEE